MNRNQVRLAWSANILLSIVAVMVGITLANTSQGIGGILLMFAVPILLIFGLAYIRSGQKKRSEGDLDPMPATMRALEAMPCPECGKTFDAKPFLREALLKKQGPAKT